MTGIHLNLLAVRRDLKMIESPTPEEKVFLEQLAHFLKEETGYQWIQGTKPQTLAFGLSDSPAGLAAWIVEKFRTWTDCGGNPGERGQPRRDAGQHLALLVHRLHRLVVLALLRAHARALADPRGQDGRRADGLRASSPRRSCARRARSPSRTYTDIRRWSVMAKGGHFAALEQPDALAHEVVEFFRALR